MRGTKWAIGFVMMLLGLLLAMQFRVHRQAPADPSRLRADELTFELKASQQALQASEQERARLAAELERLRSGEASLEALQQGISRLELLAGTIALEGPGVSVTLSESPEVASGKTRLSDEDLWRVVHELLAAGAEALSVNGERITAITAIRNVGKRIMIHQSMISSPVEVLAVGDAKVMEAALLMRGGVIEILDRWGIKATVLKSDKIRIPAMRAAPSFQYARPVAKP